MKVFGYKKSSTEDTLLKLGEVTFEISFEELDRLIAFFQDTRDEWRGIVSEKGAIGETHSHLQMWWKGWTKAEPDVIIYYGSGERQSKSHEDGKAGQVRLSMHPEDLGLTRSCPRRLDSPERILRRASTPSPARSATVRQGRVQREYAGRSPDGDG